MLRLKALLLAMLFAVTILLTPLVQAQDQDSDQESTSQARIVRLSYVEGGVQLATDGGMENATMNVPLTEGDRLSTDSSGWAEVQLEDGSTIRLAPSTQMSFAELGRDSSGSTLTTVDLDAGEAEFKVSRQHDNQFAVTVGTRTIVLDHSGRFRVTSTNQDPLDIVVFKGAVNLKDPDSGEQVAVKKGETFTLDPMDPDHYALDKEAEADDLDDWSQQRDDALKSYGATEVAANVQSPYQYGFNDLNYYGTYYDVPGYGWLWQPTGAGLGWDPFMNGYWTLTPYGYCWVSAYPWGWMPYRYGQWIFVNGRGWMWQPGGWHGWWRRPRVINTPPGFHPPAPPPARTVVSNPRFPALSPERPDRRPRRVFTNDDVEGSARRGNVLVPREGSSDRVIHAETKPAIVPRQGGSAGVIHTETKPAIVPRQTRDDNRDQRGRNENGGDAAEFRRGPQRVPPAPVRTQPEPAPPVLRAHPAPAVVPQRPVSPPAPAPHAITPAPPAPHVSSPPPAPRSVSPPATPHVGGSFSRGETAPTGRRR
jgi:uncharacterized protein DUF6600/FecR-like protein